MATPRNISCTFRELASFLSLLALLLVVVPSTCERLAAAAFHRGLNLSSLRAVVAGWLAS